MKPGDRFEHRFDTEGVYQYFCQVHPWMTGTVLVTSDEKNETIKRAFNYKLSMDIVTETEPDTLQNAVRSWEEKFGVLTKILEEIGIPAEQMSQVSVNFDPVYYGAGQYSSYNANSQISVKADIESIDRVARAAQEAGANVDNIFLTFSDSTIDNARKELSKQALANAESRAMEIIGPMGLEIKGVRNIELNTNPITPYSNIIQYKGVNIYPYYDPTSQGSGEISASVTVEFEIGKQS